MKNDKLIVANWKMNKTIDETEKFFRSLKGNVNNIKEKLNFIFCVPFLNIPKAVECTADTDFKIFAQNCYFENNGAFTGEISPKMILNSGALGVILGHSERRNYFNETNEIISKKVECAVKSGLNVILCIGENLNEKDLGISHEVIAIQLKKALNKIDKVYAKNVFIAYEPCWAIGSGVTPKNFEISEICNFLKNQIYSIIGSNDVKVLYGGSVDTQNIKQILEIEILDGVLVGSASLKVENFLKLIDLVFGGVRE